MHERWVMPLCPGLRPRHLFGGLLGGLLGMASIVALGDESTTQADVYNRLYDAYVHCDANFVQARSAFITEKLERSRGAVSIASLITILSENVRAAEQEIADSRADREEIMSGFLNSQDDSTDQHTNAPFEDDNRYKTLQQLDAVLSTKLRYVEVHECVRSVL